jgi:hypothetical protein
VGIHSLTIVHTLPGRIRLRVEPALSNFDQMLKQVQQHPGISTLAYNRTTQSILARFDPATIANSEIVMRIAVAISVTGGMRSVGIGTSPRHESVDRYGLISGSIVAAAAVSRIVAAASPVTSVLATAAGVGTTAAILSHAWREYRQRGDFHPETLSVIYLGSSFARGSILQAAVVAWLATFARHFGGTAAERYVVEVEPAGGEGRYSVRVRRFRETESAESLLHFATSMIAEAVAGAPHRPDSFLSQMKEVSRSHADVLEGLEGLDRTIHLSIE